MTAGYASSRLEALPYRGYILRLVLIISLGGFFELYDLFLTAYTIPTLLKDGIYHLKTPGVFALDAVATYVAALFAGMFVGAALLGGLPDRYGRRPVFTCALLGYSLCTFVMAFQSSALWIDFWRFLAAIGIGLEQVAIVTYVSELVQSRYRGRAIALTQSIAFLAMPVVALVASLLIPLTVFGLEGWRWVVMIGAAGAVLVWKIRRALPESPVWLERRGHHAQARAVLDAIALRAGAAPQASAGGDRAAPPETVAPEASATSAARPAADSARGAAARAAPSGWAAVFAPDMRWRIAMMVVVNVCITVGYYGFASWVPTLLLAKGITTTRSLQYSILMAIAAPLAPALSMLLADRIERKFQVMLTCSVCALLGIAFSLQSMPAVVIAIGFLLTLNNGWMSSCYHTYQAELFPTPIRAQAVGFVYSWSRFSAIFCSYLIAYFLERYGNIGVFGFITASMIVIVVTLQVFGPKTNQTVA